MLFMKNWASFYVNNFDCVFLQRMKSFLRILKLLRADLDGTIIYMISTRKRINGINNVWPSQRRKKISVYKIPPSEALNTVKN